jgi:predicted phosphodiesterase
MTTSSTPARTLRLHLLAGLVLLLAATGTSAGLQIVWGPILGDLTATSAQLAWYTNLPSYGYVEVGGQAVARGGPALAHKVMLKGLQPGTSYRYRLVAEAEGQQVTSLRYRFTTPAAGLDSFTFCAYGDTRSDPEAHARVVKAMMTCAPALILHVGDLVSSDASLPDWHQFFPVIARFSPTVPLYPCLGNHEGNAENYYDFLPLPAGGGDHGCEWYTTTYGNCQFIVLDNNRRLQEQSAWLQDLLAKPRPAGVRWRIAMFHAPPYTSGPHGPDAGALKYFCPYLEAPGGVDLVFNGHNHNYERSLKKGLNYVTVGGGGAPLYPNPALTNPYRQAFAVVYSFARVQVSADSLELSALDTSGKQIDQCTVTR